jgi:chromosome segregation ATPase
MAPSHVVASAVLAALSGQAAGLQTSNQANPVRKVVTMLEKMTKKVEAEGEHEADLFAKYMCYCKNAGNTLGASISDNNAKVPELQSSIEKSEAEKIQLAADLDKARTDRAAAKDAMAQATSIREKDAAAFAKLKAEADANIGALTKAITAVENGMAGFLQTTAASALKKLMDNLDSSKVSDVDRQDLVSFLSGTQSTEYTPSGGEITGILKQLNDEMKKDLADATSSEEGAIKTFDELMAAKKKEVAALTAAIESKTIRSGEVAVEIVTMKNELSDSETALIEDQKFLADMDKNCATKEKEWEVVKATRAEELVALAETVKILNDDDALELFKKTLPGSASAASFVQMEAKSLALKSKALAALRAVHTMGKPGGDKLNFIMMALRGKKIGFEKVIKMVDEMVATLKKEQTDDDDKFEYCKVQLDNLDDKKKGLERDVSDAEKAIADAEETIDTLKADIKALSDAIKALDKSVVSSTEQRKEENTDYKDLMASDTAAKELLEFAKNRLNKFYNPKLYKPAPKRELSEEDRIAVNMGGTMAPTPAPGGIAGTGIALAAVAPPPPPEAVAAYKKKGEESTGVIAMIDLLIKDLDKELTEASTAEKDAQADFETAMQDAAEQRSTDTKTLADKESAKADTEGMLQAHTDSHASDVKELMATQQVIMSTHAECDWLMQYYDARKEARSAEVDALKNAKAVLSGADYSFLQVSESKAPEDELAKEMTHDLEMNFNKIAPFGKEDTAKELQDHAAKTQDTLVDAVENAEVAEIKRAVFRALTRLRAATIKEFDTIARLETQAIDAYNDAHHYRAENPLAHLHEDEAPVETDKLKSFH